MKEIKIKNIKLFKEGNLPKNISHKIDVFINTNIPENEFNKLKIGESIPVNKEIKDINHNIKEQIIAPKKVVPNEVIFLDDDKAYEILEYAKKGEKVDVLPIEIDKNAKIYF